MGAEILIPVQIEKEPGSREMVPGLMAAFPIGDVRGINWKLIKVKKKRLHEFLIFDEIWTLETVEKIKSRFIPYNHTNLEVFTETVSLSKRSKTPPKKIEAKEEKEQKKIEPNWYLNNRILNEFEFKQPRDRFIFELFTHGYTHREIEYWLSLSPYEAVTHQSCHKFCQKTIETFVWRQSWNRPNSELKGLKRQTDKVFDEAHKQLLLANKNFRPDPIDRSDFNIVLQNLEAGIPFQLCVEFVKHRIKFGNNEVEFDQTSYFAAPSEEVFDDEDYSLRFD